MVDLMNLSDQVDKDFALARRRAWMRALGARFSSRSGRGTLLPFEETRRALGTAGGLRLGRQTVELSRVVGSVGQHDRFDAAFMPLRSFPREMEAGGQGLSDWPRSAAGQPLRARRGLLRGGRAQ